MDEVRLNDADEAILSALEEGRATAVYISEKTRWSREYLTQRLVRLEEHGFVENLEDTGLYELRRPLEDTDEGRSGG